MRDQVREQQAKPLSFLAGVATIATIAAMATSGGGCRCTGREKAIAVTREVVTDAGRPEDGGEVGAPEEAAGELLRIAAAGSTTCAVSSTGRVWCWGGNGYGQLGTDAGAVSRTPQRVEGIVEAEQVAVGERLACARMRTGAVRCWGQLKDPSEPTATKCFGRDKPCTIVELDEATDLAVGGDFACVRKRSGVARCWKALYSIDGVADVKAITAYQDTIYAVMNDGSGRLTGQSPGLPPSGSTYLSGLTKIPGFDGVLEVVGTGAHACARLSGGGLKCWNSPIAGAMPPPRTPQFPAAVSGVSDVTALAAGFAHTCVVAAGRVHCWGLAGWGRSDGRLGYAPAGVCTHYMNYAPYGTDPCSLWPAGPIPKLAGVTHLAVGDAHSCARSNEGVFCWGSNTRGELGDGSEVESSEEPRRVVWPPKPASSK